MTSKSNPKADMKQSKDDRRRSLRTLTLLLLEAVPDPERLKLAYSLGDGYFFQMGGNRMIIPRDVERIRRAMQARVKENSPIKTLKMKRAELLRELKKQGRNRTHAWLQDRPGVLPPVVKQGKNLVCFDGPLCDRTGDVGTWDLIAYPPGILLRLPPNGNSQLRPFRERPALFRAFYEGDRWGEIHGASYISDVNHAVRSGGFTELIRVSEALHERQIARIADTILTRQPRPHVVLISGPSSSGKTSFSLRLATQLRLLGLHPYAVGLDNYYLPRSKVPRTPEGDYDYECLQALDVEYFNETLLRLIAGESVRLPVIDFKTHRRRPGPPVHLDEHSILIVEGIHGLNPALTPHLTAGTTFKVYVSALTHLNLDRLNRVSTRDLRLLRRLVRDERARGYTADDTLSRWDSVRDGELRHIFPFQEEADIMFNSALPYELNVLKKAAHNSLVKVKVKGLKNRVERLISVLAAVEDVDEELVDRHLPPTSIMREFSGGSVLVS